MSAAPSTTREQRAEELTRTTEAAIFRLAEELSQGHTTSFLELLAFSGRFWSYSATNCLLIQRQCPHATRLAGYARWQRLGYQVAKGATAIWIWCPMRKQVLDAETGEETERVVAFRPGPVFDASQLANLDERPLPTLWRPLPDDVEPLYRRTRQRVEAAGIAVAEEPLPHGVQGLSKGGAIVLRSGLDSRNRLLTLLHELVHELAHHGAGQRGKPKRLKEFEAESTSYVVAAALGVEHPTARDYLLSYQATAEALKPALGTIQRLAQRVLRLVATDPIAAPAETEASA